jgi:hypothetical protein
VKKAKRHTFGDIRKNKNKNITYTNTRAERKEQQINADIYFISAALKKCPAFLATLIPFP